MSLTLRQKTQDALNNAGLDDYHTRIDSDKYLAIVGPCGQPLITVSGIEFTRREPTVAEITFAVELFETFLLDHSADIQDYLTKLKKHAQTWKPAKQDDIFTIENDGYGNSHMLYVEYQDGPMELTLQFDESGDLYVKSGKFHTGMLDPNQWIKFTPNAVLMHTATAFLQEFSNYTDEAEALSEAKSKLSQCDI